MTIAADRVTISALAAAAGTLVLAIATFASVRSANHAARVAERVITRFALRPRDGGGWTATAARHWNIDRDDPR